MKMTQKKLKCALIAALTTAGLSASAAKRPLPTPPPSPYADTESSVNVSLTEWPNLGNWLRLDLTTLATPSNSTQVAFGQNGSELYCHSGNQDKRAD